MMRPQLRHIFCGQTRNAATPFGVKKHKPCTDPDSILFAPHHQLKPLHSKAKRELRLKKRAEYAKAKGLK